MGRVEKRNMQTLKALLLPIYPETTRQVFDMMDKKLGNFYNFGQLSLCLHTEIKQRYKLTPIQLVTFGFLCPDHEFQAKLTHFMYSQIESTFTFSEDLVHFKRFVKMAEWNDPIALFSFPEVNIVNLVSSVATHYGFPLKVLRADPVLEATLAAEALENGADRDLVNKQLLDLTNVRQEMQLRSNHIRCQYLVHKNVKEPDSNQVIAKENWFA